MLPPIDYGKEVRFEYLRGREAMEALEREHIAYLPVGCLERHGDHLPMGLDVIKAHGICRLAAQRFGGVVFPPHYYSGIHLMNETQLAHFTGDWGNIYTDSSCEAHLIDLARQLALAGVKTLVIYSGHYPPCQIEMLECIAAQFAGSGMTVIPFAECHVLEGDHAGISETSIMLYLDKSLVNMAQIAERNYADHPMWSEEKFDPKNSSVARGEQEVMRVLEALGERIAVARR